MCEGIDDEFACLNCTRPECLFEHRDMEGAKVRQREAKQKYYWAHREEILQKQREYDRAHKRPHRERKRAKK